MDFAVWAVLIGMLLVAMALAGTVVQRLPLSTAMLYLLAGIAVSPLGLGLLWASPTRNTLLLERLTEVVVLISLFTAGLKLSPSIKDKRWILPIRLATVSMVVTVGLIALLAFLFVGLPLGAAVLLGAILAPTDPVLASDVQVHDPGDRDRLRFALTGEGGLNDGTAFPFVMLGLGMMGLHDLGQFGWRWFAVDVLWATGAGLGIGVVLGLAVGRLVLYLRREHKEAVGTDDFLALGLIGLAYGVALTAHAYGFLAVFAAGVALRQLERAETARSVGQPAAPQRSDVDSGRSVADAQAVHPDHAPAFMAQALLGFNQQLERIGEVVVVIVIGAILWAVEWHNAAWWFVPVLFLLVRPLAVSLGLAASASDGRQRWLVSWFGIRGIGSLYYLMYAINHGLAPDLAGVMVALTLSVVVTSIVVHGISVTPMMAAYNQRVRKRRQEKSQ